MFQSFHWASFLVGLSAGLVVAFFTVLPYMERRRGGEPEAQEKAPPVLKKPKPPALVMEREDMLVSYNESPARELHPVPYGFWANPVRMVSRDVCETDESTLQLLPYVMVVDAHTHKVLTYSRDPAGGEQRLHGLQSVGFGGHVDAPPPPGVALEMWMKIEATRELREEIGLAIDARRLLIRGLIGDPTNPVGRVHLGILMLVMVEGLEVGDSEDAIGNRRWESPADLVAGPLFDALEPWSKVAIINLAAQGVEEAPRPRARFVDVNA